MREANNYTKEEKIKAYIKEKEDPYSFLSGGKKVTMCFSSNSRTIESQLKQYMIIMSRCDCDRCSF